MKKLALLMLLVLPACETAEETAARAAEDQRQDAAECQLRGFTPGNAKYDNCMAILAQNRVDVRARTDSQSAQGALLGTGRGSYNPACSKIC